MKWQPSALILQTSALLFAMSWWLWSFTQTDPNLYYSSTNLWVQFQQLMWQINRPTVLVWYSVMIVVGFILYFYALTTKIQKIPLLLATCCLLLIFSNNALSHDIYNYIFNAKAMLVYHQDPHVMSALEIAPHDDLVRFMHNVHTPAPYGHVWTYLTLVPYAMGFGKFITTYFSFKLFMAIGFGLLAWVQWRLLKDKSKILLFILNPLVLVETLSTGHNDVWMMLLAWVSLWLLSNAKKTLSLKTLLSFGLLVLSTQIKEASIVLLPVWALFLCRNMKVPQTISRLQPYWADIAALLMFLPLLTSRSQQFNPWYLIWSLSFLPFIQIRSIRTGLNIFSLTSMLRYLPFLLVGGYSDTVQLQMRLITWSAIPLTVLFMILSSRLFKRR